MKWAKNINSITHSAFYSMDEHKETTALDLSVTRNDELTVRCTELCPDPTKLKLNLISTIKAYSDTRHGNKKYKC